MLRSLPDVLGTGTNPVQLSATPIRANWVRFQALTHTNSAVVRVGDASVSSTQGLVVPIGGDELLEPASATNSFDLSQIYLWIANGDVVNISYNQT
jgi:hypothetical protein